MLRIILFIIIFMILPVFSHSATFQVQTVAELEAALVTASGNDDHDVIRIAEETYMLSASLTYDSFEDKTITLQGSGGAVIIDGGLINHRLLFMRTYTSNADITISGITFQNGYSPEFNNGAGVFINISSADLVIENSKIIDCFGAAFYNTIHGGGAYIIGGLNANILIRNCVIAGNTCKGLGGGMYLSVTDGTLSFINNTIVNNLNKTSIVEGGGGIYLRLFFDTAIANLYNNIFWGNVFFVENNGDLYIEDNGDGANNAAEVNFYNNDYNQLDYNIGTNMISLNNISQEPDLSGDFHLLPDSPCVDAGTASAPDISSIDFEGDPRSHDGDRDGSRVPDMGADEYYEPPDITPVLMLLLGLN